ncbi:MAG: winged helix DNA-binding domain-containing protein [Thermoanaerobaculia bacterium]|nr:winged helix DNA-binding domain-containing protein [Thermoanaerobaculia bacterium]
MERLDTRTVRRLAVARAGLLTPERTGLTRRASGSGLRARRGAWDVLCRFGYLQLDSVSVVGARTHGLVLLSRLDGFDPRVAEKLLRPGDPVFEFWGHEASWLPMELYPAFGFRRREYKVHPWWGPLLDEHPLLADEVLQCIETEGPLRTQELQQRLGADDARGDWWGFGRLKKVLSALWSSGELVVSERRSFHRTYDLAERVIPEEVRRQESSYLDSLETLLLRALDGHGWATRSTLAATWRFQKMWDDVDAALARLQERGEIVPCRLVRPTGEIDGWIRPRDLHLAESLRRSRPRRAAGILLSPFDPLLWDRDRVEQLFDFEQILEIYKPAAQRRWGYYCLPILAGEHLIGRVDLKAHRDKKGGGRLQVRALHFERDEPTAADREAARAALERLAGQLCLELWAENVTELRRRLGAGRSASGTREGNLPTPDIASSTRVEIGS